ncbi:MAG: transposase [Candidatus Sumerlaeia bacterium]
MGRFYQRHLPHGAPDDSPIFITWNLKGALPQLALDRIHHLREQFNKTKIRPSEIAKRIFRISEEFLDRAQSGPLYLKDPEIALIVVDNLIAGAGKYYDFFAFVIMANHVHVLLRPYIELEKITGGIKKSTARRINSKLNRVGQSFWQDESFDHRPRCETSFRRFLKYIEENPVNAGLCRRPEDWPWSSASMRADWPVGQAYHPIKTPESGRRPDLPLE